MRWLALVGISVVCGLAAGVATYVYLDPCLEVCEVMISGVD